MFKSTPESFPAKFVPGDIFDDSFLTLGPVSEGAITPSEPEVDIASLTSLNPLRGRLSAIHAANFFHLFSEEQQTIVAKKFASLLSPEPGSLIFGAHVAKAEAKGVYPIVMKLETVQSVDMFSHCPESWTTLWEEVFGPGKVEVKTSITSVGMKGFEQNGKAMSDYMTWSVVRL